MSKEPSFCESSRAADEKLTVLTSQILYLKSVYSNGQKSSVEFNSSYRYEVMKNLSLMANEWDIKYLKELRVESFS